MREEILSFERPKISHSKKLRRVNEHSNIPGGKTIRALTTHLEASAGPYVYMAIKNPLAQTPELPRFHHATHK
jgi:hypothetical protein